MAAAEEREEPEQVEERSDHGAVIVCGSEPRDQPLVPRTSFGEGQVRDANGCFSRRSASFSPSLWSDAWLVQVGTGVAGSSRQASRATSVVYGVAAALTLDEFALWLRLEDVYWSVAGRESVHAVILFGGLLSVGVWGGPFFHALLREAARILHRGGVSHEPPAR